MKPEMKIFNMFLSEDGRGGIRLSLCLASACMFLAGGFPAYSQNLDPTVEVSRAYVAKKMDVSKSQMKMEIPDSVLKFDIDFDYTVNDSPYRGSYEFRPYVLDIKPETGMQDGNSFFLRAGAGYELHPVLDFVYAPKIRKVPFTMSLYGTHRSYFGKYRTVSAEQSPDICRTAWDGKGKYSGYDAYTSAGIDGRADWKRGYLSFDLGYDGYADKDAVRTRGYDAFRAFLRFASNNRKEKYFFYDASVSYRYGEDKIAAAGKSCVTMHDVSVDASLGPVFSRGQRVLLNLSADVSEYGAWMSSFAGRLAFTPKYIFSRARWNLDIGVKFSGLFGKDLAGAMHRNKGQFIYPDIEMDFSAINGYLNIYLKADGGEDINRYSDLIGRNRHFSSLYMRNGVPLLDNTVERVKTVLGFRGNISSRLLYDLKGGYAFYDSMFLDAVCDAGGGSFFPSTCYADCNYYFAALDLKWQSQDVSAGFSAEYCGTDLGRRNAPVIAPSPFTVDAHVVYNWKKRIFAGIHCNASAARSGYAAILQETTAGSAGNVGTAWSSGTAVKVPGYVDLGVSAEYRFNRKMSFWLYGGNLLNMTIQRVPLYAESGISITGGITLNL